MTTLDLLRARLGTLTHQERAEFLHNLAEFISDAPEKELTPDEIERGKAFVEEMKRKYLTKEGRE